jgi:Ser/Thr protein kinase RdoA (MazF antagonist)
VDDPDRKSKAEVIFKYFDDYVVPKIPCFGKGIIHGDCNGLNIILDKKHNNSLYEVAGVIDFGECIASPTVFDLGTCLPYIMMENMNPYHCSNAIEFVGPLIQGYDSVLPLNSDEFDSLYYLVLARCIQTAVLGAHCFKAEPWNTYLLTTPEKAWTLVDLLLSTSKEVVNETWKKYFGYCVLRVV